MKYSIEKIENNIAVCENDDGETLKLNLSQLPPNAKEGDILIQSDEGFTLDLDETQARRRKMAELQKNIFSKK